MNDEEFAQWKAERDAVAAGTFEEFKAYSIKMGLVPSNPESLKIMYHKCRTAITSLSDEIRQASHEWLTEQGYSSWLE